MPQTVTAPRTPVLPPYAPEMPVSDLRTAEAFLVTTLRLWLAEKANGTKVPRDWRSGFLAAGLEEDAAPDFDMALRILHAGAQPPLALREFRHPRLATDEARLLSVFGYLQRGDIGSALTELQYRLPTKSLRWMLRYARCAAGALPCVASCCRTVRCRAPPSRTAPVQPLSSTAARRCCTDNSARQPPRLLGRSDEHNEPG